MPREKIEERDMLPPGMKHRLYAETGGKCAHCGQTLAYRESTVDHIIPLSKGGTNEACNLTVLCEDCNKAKYNHVIEPESYYDHMPEKKLAQARAMFQSYLDGTEWLAWENLFRTDRFACQAKQAVMSPKSGKIFLAPMTIQVRKMLPTEAFDWLQLYRAHARPADRCLIIDDPRHIEHPFYEITSAGKPIAVFECYMGVDEGLVSEEKLPCVMMNMFSHWDLKYKENLSGHTMLRIVDALMGQIHDTFIRTARGSLAGMVFKSVLSDRHIAAMLRVLPPKSMHAFAQEGFQGLDPDAKVIGFTAILFNGTDKDIEALVEKTGAKDRQDMYMNADKAAIAKPIMDSLESQPEDLKPDRILYKDMNGSYTAHHRKPGKKPKHKR